MVGAKLAKEQPDKVKRIGITELRYTNIRGLKKLVADGPVIVEAVLQEDSNGRTKTPVLVAISYDHFIKCQELMLKGL